MKQIAKIIDKNTIEVYEKSQFNINAILQSGQVFRYSCGDNCVVFAGKNRAEIRQDAEKMTITCNDADYFWRYFDLDTDYEKIKENLSHFGFIKKILLDKSIGGIRILKGEFVEIVVSFIISANNNIKRIQKIIDRLCKLCGDIAVFPDLECLGKLSEKDFFDIGCGYRSPYLVSAVKQLKNLNYDALDKLSNEQLKKELLKIMGVGEKVCACIMLFGFHRLNAIPQDVWIKRALEQVGAKDASALLNHKYAGVAQQYIFYYTQHLKKKL